MEKILNQPHASCDDLVERLARVDIKVPRRHQGRKTEHTESWSVCRFLATFASTPLFSYPFQISKGERPDFRFQFGQRIVGAETTEAVSRQLAHYSSLMGAENERRRRAGENDERMALIDSWQFRPGHPKHSNATLQKMLCQHELDPTSEGWVGNEAEKDWVAGIAEVISAKSESARKPGYCRNDENWLIIYDNLSLPAIHLDEALPLFLEKMREENRRGEFSQVFIEQGQSIVRLFDGMVSTYPLVDLWQSR